MLSYTLFENKNSTEYVTFVHGAGGSSTIWFKQIREFKKYFNVILLDLRGHGESGKKQNKIFKGNYTFKTVANDVYELLQHLKVEKSHFVGISLGTIVIRQLAEMYPYKVQSMIMGGAIMQMNFRSQILMKLGNLFKNMIPYLLLYKLFAFIIMPKKNHKQSRLMFVNEAKKLYQKEFIRWFKLTTEINPLLKWFRQVELNIPTLYIMGDEDYMFLPAVKKVVESHVKTAQLFIVKNCGHVVNVDNPTAFNQKAIEFLLQKNKPKTKNID
nr:alpha/beta hydrolase [uncultured Flavobacterium sp.]